MTISLKIYSLEFGCTNLHARTREENIFFLFSLISILTRVIVIEVFQLINIHNFKVLCYQSGSFPSPYVTPIYLVSREHIFISLNTGNNRFRHGVFQLVSRFMPLLTFQFRSRNYLMDLKSIAV